MILPLLSVVYKFHPIPPFFPRLHSRRHLLLVNLPGFATECNKSRRYHPPLLPEHKTAFATTHSLHPEMPAILPSSKRKAPPDGFSDIEEDLLIFSNQMKDALNTPTDNIPKHQAQWPVFQISHKRSRYIYELYYEKEAISKRLYDWLLKNNYADAMLIAKWKKQGYEKVSSHTPPSEIEVPVHNTNTRFCYSYVASSASRRRRQTSTRPVSAEYRKRN